MPGALGCSDLSKGSGVAEDSSLKGNLAYSTRICARFSVTRQWNESHPLCSLGNKDWTQAVDVPWVLFSLCSLTTECGVLRHKIK